MRRCTCNRAATSDKTTNDKKLTHPSTMSAVAIGHPVVDAEIIAPKQMTRINTPIADAEIVAPKKMTRISTPVLNSLDAQGFPRGLATAVADSVAAFPLRIVVVDNSGSMQTGDGSTLVRTSNGTLKSITSTRWRELTTICAELSELASSLNAPTHFHLLNPCSAGQYFAIADGDGGSFLGKRRDAMFGVDAFRSAMNSDPTGSTPLTESVEKIIRLIEPHTATLQAQDQKVVVVLATDGLPNNPKSFFRALQTLQSLPVWLCLRLCTDQDDAVEYWSGLDKQLERPLETLDDLKSEAGEVAKKNPWLTYAPALQLARTLGLRDKLFDLMDEQKLAPTQVKSMVERILGCDALPEPEVELSEFLAAVDAAQSRTTAVYNPLTAKMDKWFPTDKLERAVSNGGGDGCLIM